MAADLIEMITKLKDIKIKNDFQTYLMPNIFNKNWDENFNSDWLAYILNPKTNSLGVQPINILLSAFDNIQISEESNVIMEEGEFGREVYLDPNNRIDFLIKIEPVYGKPLLLAIENKIRSGESKGDQLKQYSNLINEKYKDEYTICLIYLTINGDYPSADNGFKPFSHRDFVKALKKIHLDPISYPRESFLIQEYINNMEENILAENNYMDDNDLVLFSKYNDDINTLINQRDLFIKSLRHRIYSAIDSLFEDDYVCSGIGNVNKGYCQWYKEKQWDDWHVHFEVLISNKSDNEIKVALHDESKDKSLAKRLKKNKTEIDCSKTFYIKDICQEGIEVLMSNLLTEMQNLKDTYEKEIDDCFR